MNFKIYHSTEKGWYIAYKAGIGGLSWYLTRDGQIRLDSFTTGLPRKNYYYGTKDEAECALVRHLGREDRCKYFVLAVAVKGTDTVLYLATDDSFVLDFKEAFIGTRAELEVAHTRLGLGEPVEVRKIETWGLVE